MSRRLARLPLALFALAVGCSRTNENRAVVIVVIDTLRRDALGCYGAGADPSPRIDQLAEEGVRFEQAISASGWTLPSVASLLTGTWPSVHKATGKKTRLTPISEDVRTATEILQEHGLATGAVANAAFLSPLLGAGRGFDVFDHRHAFNRDVRRADASVAAALRFVEEHEREDFFLLVHLFDPHLDYDPPGELASRFAAGREEPAPPLGFEAIHALTRNDGELPPSPEDQAHVRAIYQGEVAFVDRAIGALVDALRERGLWERTSFVLTADHGEEFWDHGGFEHGHSLYDELVRVPLIVKPPASVAITVPVVETPVRVLDVMPTVFEICALPAPQSFVGRSLLPLVRGESRESRPAFLESTLYGPDREGVRGERYKYLVERHADGTAREELYDWRTDPLETQNLAPARPDLLAEMRAAHASFRAQIDALAASTRPGEVREIDPATVEEYERSIESLGYAGREEEND